MIEVKLQQTAAMMPKPKGDFLSIEETVKKNAAQRTHNPRKLRRTAVVICLILLLVGCGAKVAEAKWMGWTTHTQEPWFLRRAAEKTGIVLPEQIEESPFYSLATAHVVPTGTSKLEALIAPVYRWYAVDYRIVEYKTARDEYGTSRWLEDRDFYSLYFGTTENEMWKHCFGYDENGDWSEPQNIVYSHSEEYEGVILQIYTQEFENSLDGVDYHWFTHSIEWVDSKNQAVFRLYESEDAGPGAEQFPQDLLDTAKEIINLNK